jgi:hypothetical protein
MRKRQDTQRREKESARACVWVTEKGREEKKGVQLVSLSSLPTVYVCVLLLT